jgi:hypothetical protein
MATKNTRNTKIEQGRGGKDETWGKWKIEKGDPDRPSDL